MNTITNDWEERVFPIKLQNGSEYMATCYVYLRLREVPDPYHWPPRDTQISEWTLEGWNTLPYSPPEDSEEIERQLLVLLEELYGQ